jgi:MFS family permease
MASACSTSSRPASVARTPLVLLGVVAFCGFLLDGAAYNWSAVHLGTAYHAPPALAAAAFTVFTFTLALGRLASDRLTARLGRMRVVQLAGVVSAAGAALAITAPTAAASLAGWAIFGLGLAAIAPTVLGAAGGAKDLPAPVAIAAVTTSDTSAPSPDRRSSASSRTSAPCPRRCGCLSPFRSSLHSLPSQPSTPSTAE